MVCPGSDKCYSNHRAGGEKLQLYLDLVKLGFIEKVVFKPGLGKGEGVRHAGNQGEKLKHPWVGQHTENGYVIFESNA